VASKKKSPGPVRMKPWKGWSTPERKGVAQIAWRNDCDFFRADGAIPVLVTELGAPAPDERIERIRKMCKDCLVMNKSQWLAVDILKVLNTKPGRKR